MRLMIVGDTHGGQNGNGSHAKDRFVGYKMKLAKAMGADRMIIVGDFGMWPGYGGIQFLDDLNAMAREHNIDVYALIGNHDDHNQWDWWINGGVKDDSGFTYVRDRVKIAPKVHFWKWGGKKHSKRFGIAGGAVSIDRQWRTENVSYWSDEPFGERHLNSVLSYKGPRVDYFLTHDCSDKTPWGFALKNDYESQRNRQRIDKAINHLKPRMHFHGHMHAKYNWINGETYTYGLDCNGEDNSWVILDTGADADQPDKVYWPNEALYTLMPSGFES